MVHCERAVRLSRTGNLRCVWPCLTVDDLPVSGATMGSVGLGGLSGLSGLRGRGLHSSTFLPNLSHVGHTSPCPPV